MGGGKLGDSTASNLIYIPIHTHTKKNPKTHIHTHLMIFTTVLFVKGHGIQNYHECPPLGDN